MSYEDLFKGKKIVASDTETTGLIYHGSFADYGYYPAAPFAFSFTTYEMKQWYIRFPVDPYTRRVMYEKNLEGYYRLCGFYSRKDIHTVWHNANFDLSVCARVNIPIKTKISDTMILSHIDNVSLPTALKPLCKKLFQIDDDDQKDLIASVNKARRRAKKLGYCLATKERGFGDKPNLADFWLGDPALCKKYALMDTDRTIGLWYCHEKRYAEDDVYRELVDMEHELMHIIRRMQDRGIRVDEAKIEELINYYEDIISRQEKIKKEMGYGDLNSRSSKQMQEVFYKKLGCSPEYKRRKDKETGETKQTLTTDSDTLSKWAKTIPLAKCLVEISAANSELGTFIKPFRDISVQTPDGKVLRPNYRTVGVVTGRISCAKPNLMNISSNDSVKRVAETLYRARECFIPRAEHVLVFFDYSQIEVWITAFLSKDETMIEYLLNGGDLHAKTGESCFGDKPDYEENKKAYRKKGKTLNFGSIYGMGASLLMHSIDCTYQEADEALNKFWAAYPGLDAYRAYLSDRILEVGKVANPFGREYYMHKDNAYRALNYMVQGSAAEVLKRAMINVDKILNHDVANILLTIHDEICIEVHRSAFNKIFMRAVVERMQANFHTYFGMPRPFGVDVEYTKTSWFEKKKISLQRKD